MSSSTAVLDPGVIPETVPGIADAAAARLIADAHQSLAGIVGVDRGSLSANGLLVFTAGIAGLARLLDGAQVTNTVEIVSRSDRRSGYDGLAARHGCATPAQLVETVTGASSRTARQLVRVAAQTGPRLTDTGLPLDALFPITGAALGAGRIGVDVADAITTTLKCVTTRVAPDSARWAEQSLVNHATGIPDDDDTDGVVPLSADLIREQAVLYRDVLDPDGIEPRDEHLIHLRALRFTPQPNGMLAIAGQLPPEQAAVITTVFDAYLSPRTAPAFPPETDSGSAATSEPDLRSRDQQRADILTALCEGVTKLGLAPTLHGAAPTVIVTITDTDLSNRTGAGTSPSTRQPLPAATVEQFACDGGTHHCSLGAHGEILQLTTLDRFFTTHQRKAMIARDGPTCAHPGCHIPAYWCEAHHIIPNQDGGPTTIDNGVLLCWFHHRLHHHGDWAISAHHGTPHFHPPAWLPQRSYPTPPTRTIRT